MKTYKVVIKREELLSALSDYYSKKNNDNIKVKVNVETGYYGYYEEKIADVKFYYDEQMEVLGHKFTKSVEISKDDIKNIINTDLSSKGYEIDSIYYDAGISTVEYFTQVYEKAYFTGIELQIIKKEKDLKLNYERRN